MKIVIDTNVLINGLKDEYSHEKRIIDAVIAGDVQAFANRQTVQENRLLSSQLIDNPEYEAILEKLFSKIHFVVNRHNIQIVRDPEDNKILESAVEARADYLVTSDNDLLSLEDFQGVNIVNPSHFWNLYKDDSDDLWKQWTNYIKNDRV